MNTLVETTIQKVENVWVRFCHIEYEVWCFLVFFSKVRMVGEFGWDWCKVRLGG